MELLFFQSQPHYPSHVRREVFVAPSPHPEIQLWGQCHSLYEHMFRKSACDAVILGVQLIGIVFHLEGSHIEGPRPGPGCAVSPWTLSGPWPLCDVMGSRWWLEFKGLVGQNFNRQFLPQTSPVLNSKYLHSAFIVKMTERLEQRTSFGLLLALSPDIRRVRSWRTIGVCFKKKKVWIKCAVPVVPSFSLQ
jgi:hypothetical protein